ncbi:MAG: hypothetical protein E7612_00570 [Ruminococcaceae bacterium]|nr:hypothetical protein [Oscillospiraceae bacterium]
MKIAVLIKYYKGEINPFDAAALECALESGAEVTALSMAPASVAPSLENLTRLGIKAVLITDPAYAGGDTQATSYVLSEALKRLDPDLIFAGRQSIDGDTSQVPPMLAERLGCGITVGVMEFDGEKITTRSNKSETLSEKTVYTFERIRALRFPSIFSKKGTVEIWDNDALKLDTKKCGIKGSPTRVIRSYESSVGRRSCRFASPDELEALISKSMTKSIDKNSDETVAKTDRIYYVGDIGDIARKFAFEAVSYDASGKDARKVAEELSGLGAKVVLFESNEEYKTLAARVAVICGSGLCADCISFRQEKNTFIMTRPALDGGVTADIACDSKMSLATVRKSGSADGELIFAIGRGAVPYIEKIRALAKKYHAQLAATRTVVDSGDMPYEYQVGLTGKTVSPKVYVAFGISGAVQHTSAISGAGTVIAVNTDKDARIFDYADYGIIEEIENVRL